MSLPHDLTPPLLIWITRIPGPVKPKIIQLTKEVNQAKIPLVKLEADMPTAEAGEDS
jgi:hypothetical protein